MGKVKWLLGGGGGGGYGARAGVAKMAPKPVISEPHAL
jgi:hypothetical protein